jgi:hypothetical protein
MISLGTIHSFAVFPGDISEETEDGDDEGHKIEDGGCEEPGDDTGVFGGEVEHGGDGAVDGDEDHPDYKGAWNGKEGPFCPDVSDESCFS